MTMAVTDAIARGQQAVLCASTGNTSASGGGVRGQGRRITCAVLIPQGKIAMGKARAGSRARRQDHSGRG